MSMASHHIHDLACAATAEGVRAAFGLGLILGAIFAAAVATLIAANAQRKRWNDAEHRRRLAQSNREHDHE
jgi:hypothetical protein